MSLCNFLWRAGEVSGCAWEVQLAWPCLGSAVLALPTVGLVLQSCDEYSSVLPSHSCNDIQQSYFQIHTTMSPLHPLLTKFAYMLIAGRRGKNGCCAGASCPWLAFYEVTWRPSSKWWAKNLKTSYNHFLLCFPGLKLQSLHTQYSVIWEWKLVSLIACGQISACTCWIPCIQSRVVCLASHGLSWMRTAKARTRMSICPIVSSLDSPSEESSTVWQLMTSHITMWRSPATMRPHKRWRSTLQTVSLFLLHSTLFVKWPLLLSSPLTYKLLLLEPAMQLLQRSLSRARHDSGKKKKASWVVLQKHAGCWSFAVFKESRQWGDRGILMCYTKRKEALKFASQSHQNAISQAIHEISQIHPKIRETFEVGAVQAWYSDSSSQGVFAVKKPDHIVSINKLIYHYKNIFFAGDTLSWTTNWVPGCTGVRSQGCLPVLYTKGSVWLTICSVHLV